MRIKTKLLVILLLLIVTIIINWDTIKEIASQNEKITGKATQQTQVFQENTTGPEIYFCPRDDCGAELVAWMDAAEKSIHCAFFELELENVKQKLDEKSASIEVKLVTDSDYYEQISNMSIVKHGSVRQDNKSGFMHNKFCVLDGKAVWTGSFNPTERCNYKNNNNAIFYQSRLLAANYEAEFAEMWNRTFEKGARTENPTIILNGKNISSYFCPEDWCANKVIYELQDAKSSIHFMTFSFTHDEIGKQIIALHKKGVSVKGVFEKSQNSNYTEYYPFKSAGIDVRWDGNKYNLHHKVFIIDNSTVLTGSFNPTSNGDERNDENVLIIHDPEVAARYLEEFEYVWKQASN
jgi:phosphatidylserine/phosphatidylglycerophosphate/cardiolipin synthase-like enzyme